jgi:hypothetical protein
MKLKKMIAPPRAMPLAGPTPCIVEKIIPAG